MSINHSLDQYSTQSLQQLQQLLTSSSLTFWLEPPPLPAQSDIATASQYASAWISIAATPAPLAAGLPSPPQQLGLEPEPEPPKYQMSRTAKTVEALWREWTVGLRGGPSIDMLDWQWGSQWRAGCHSEQQFYLLQLEIIKEIRHMAQAQRIREEAAMQQISKQQQNMQCSLDWLCKLLRAGRKAQNR